MKQPLIVREGLFQVADEEPLQILALNFGIAEPLTVNSSTVAKYLTRHTLVRGTSRKVDTILGGEEGDLLMLQGDVFLVTGGNISAWTLLRMDRITQLLFTGGLWIPCS